VVTEDAEDTARDIAGPAFFAPVFFPVLFLFISVTVGILGCCLIAKRRTKSQLSYEALTKKYKRGEDPEL
jgi:hypothetical protein